MDPVQAFTTWKELLTAGGDVAWWQQFSMADDARRQDMLDQVRDEQRQRQRAQPRRSAPVAPAAREMSTAAPEGAEDADGTLQAMPKKRRRRRRKPAADGGGEASPE